MMGNMSDPSSIGPGMAIALLTTLYGAIFANIIISPLVQKISAHGKRIRRNYELVIAGIMFLHKGGDPRRLPDLLLGNYQPDDPIKEIFAASKSSETKNNSNNIKEKDE